MELTIDHFPVFEANQVLTSRHLNDVFDYLDQQTRLTRSNLIGIGIVCGLEIKLDTSGATAVLLSRGCGVTSEGYLIVEPEDVTLVSYRVYTLPADVDYPSFKDGTAQFPLWEMFPDGEPNTTGLDSPAGFLDDKAVLLFLELKKQGLRNCSPNNCDDKGSEVTATVRRLLIRIADLDKIIAVANKLGSGLTVSDIDAALTAKLNLPDVHSLRFDVLNSSPATSNDVYAGFLNVFRATKLALAAGSALSAAYDAFKPLLQAAYPTNPFAGFSTLFGFLDMAPATTAQVKFLQYYVDCFEDLLRAYDEFRWHGAELLCACCPPDGIFPRHLMLGLLHPEMSGQPGRYRQLFLPSPAVGCCAAESKAVLQLFARLAALPARFTNAPGLPKADDKAHLDPQIRVTPSVLGDKPLGVKAIPYYYSQNGTLPLYTLWNGERTRRNRANQNLSYRFDEYNPVAPAFVSDPLRYDLEPYNFLRIEGAIGKPYQRVLQTLLLLKSQYRLPIDIIAVRTGAFDDTQALDLTKEAAHFQDLEALYEALRAELLSSLAQGASDLYDVPVANSKTPGGTPKLPLLKLYVPNYRYPSGSVGAYYEQHLASFQAMPYIDVDQTLVSDSSFVGEVLRVYCVLFAGARDLPAENFAHVVALFYFSKLAEILPATLDALAYDDFENKYQDLLALVRYFNISAINNVPEDLKSFVPVQELIDQFNEVLFDCKLDAIKAVHDLYVKRVSDLKKRQFLSNFLQAHPGIQHKAGVPLGGTFILVYHDLPSPALGVNSGIIFNATRFAETLAVEAIPSVTQSLAASAAIPQAAATVSGANTRAFALTDAISRISSNQTLAQNPDISFVLGSLIGTIPIFDTPVPVHGLDDQATKIIQAAVSELANGTVIADFYLPYQICCDCTGVESAAQLGVILMPATIEIGLGESTPVQLTLSMNAPDGGVIVSLATDNSEVATLSSTTIFIPAGANAPVTQPLIHAVGSGSATIGVSAPGYASASKAVQVTASFALTPQGLPVPAGGSASLTVTLSGPALANGEVVSLSSSNTSVAIVPATVTIPPNAATAPVPVAGIAPGSATISATAANATGASADVNVATQAPMGLPAGMVIGPGQSAPFPVTLPIAAGTNLTVNLSSGDVGKVTISPASVVISAGQTQPAIQPQVTGIDFGSAIVTASATGYNSGKQTVTVAGALSFTPPSVTIPGGSAQNVTLNLSVNAPAGGLAISLTSSNVAVASAPATVTIPQLSKSVQVTINAGASGTATINAVSTAANVTGAALTVTVPQAGSIGLPGNLGVPAGTSVPLPITLSTAAPTGGVNVTLSSGDPTKVTVSTATVSIPAGQTSPAQQPQVTGIALGTANLSASAPNYGSASVPVTVSATMSLTPAFLTINVASTQNLTLTLSGAAPAGGLTVNLKSSNAAAATVSATVNVPRGATSAPVPVTGVAPGSASISAAAANTSGATANVSVTTQGAIGLPAGVVIGPGQSQAFPVTLPAAPGSGVTVNLSSGDTGRVTISPASVSITAGQTQPAAQPQVTGVNFGSSVITASATGYTSGAQAVAVAGALSFAPPSVTIPGNTTQNVTLNLSVNAPAGGLAISLSSTNAAAASAPATVTIAQTARSVQVPITAVSSATGAPGVATINAGATATGVTGAALAVTVPLSGSIGVPANIALAAGASSPLQITLSPPVPPGSAVAVTLSSGDPSKVTVSPTVVTVAAGQTSPSAAPQVVGVRFGSANVSVSAPGYGSSSVPVTVSGTISLSPANLTIAGNSTQNLTVTLSSAAPAGGVTVTVKSSNPGIATVPASVAIQQGATTAPVPVTGVSPGSAVIGANAPNVGSATAAVNVRPVEGPSMAWLPAIITLPANNKQNVQLSLSSPAPQSGIEIALSSSNPGVATVSSKGAFPPGGTFIAVVVAGVAAGIAILRATAANIPDAAATVTVTPILGGPLGIAGPPVGIVGAPAGIVGGPVGISSMTNAAAIMFTAQSACTGPDGTASLTVQVEGGAAPYEIAIDENDYQSLGQALPLQAGTHTLQIRDAEGAKSAGQTITVPDPIGFGKPVYTCKGSKYTAKVAINGGTAPYSVKVGGKSVPVNGNAITTDPVASGKSVSIEVVDSANCTANTSFTHSCPKA